MSTFSGFSEEELKRIKSGETGSNSASQINAVNVKKLDKIGYKPKRATNQYKLPILQKQNSDDSIDNIAFDKCKLSLRSPTTPIRDMTTENNKENLDKNDNVNREVYDGSTIDTENINNNKMDTENTYKSYKDTDTPVLDRKNSINEAPDIVRGVDNYSEDELTNHRVKLQELQLRQKLMEEQNKRKKEMLAKALADRTKQTTEEVLRLEKIKKELQVLDSQFSQDVSVLRQKIDHACLSYADAEKHYLKVEKEFLQAKIHLQKEKEKKELLTEHLCALITHNETRKAQKLETLMLELATDKKQEKFEVQVEQVNDVKTVEDDSPVIVDGVDERTAGRVLDTMNFDMIKERPISIMWPQRNQRNIFIKNLDKTIDNNALYDTFSAFGNILSCKVGQDENSASKGYGFVHFETEEAANKSIEKVNGMLLNGKKVYVGRFSPRKEHENEPKSGVEKVFIKNLDKTIDNKALYDTFSAFGNILSCKVDQDENSASKGYGFVHFETEEAANKSIEKVNGMLLNGKKVYVGRFIPRKEHENDHKSSVEKVFIKNLDKTIDNKALYDTFSAFGNILSCKVGQDENNASKGYGFVHFETEEAANKSIEKVNGMLLNGKKVYVGRFIPRKEHENDHKSSVEKVFIKNLDKTIDNKALYDTFSAFGNILSCKVDQDENSASKGYGFVHFETEEAANKSIEKVNGMLLNGKKVYVGRFIPRKEHENDHKSSVEKVFIKNLDKTIDNKALYDTFSAFGNILSCKVGQDENNASKGYGFVHFETEEAANKSIEKVNGMLLNGKKVYVGRFIPRKERETW